MMEIPVPILFNPLKHHLGFIRNYVTDKSITSLKSDLQKIGNSQMDLYTGAFSIDDICQQVRAHLKGIDALEIEGFEALLRQGYYKCSLDDRSEWILRKGEETNRYVHIHPGRHSPHTTRIRAATLKTIVACWKIHGIKTLAIQEVNAVRVEILALSPVSNIKMDNWVKLFI